MLHFLKPPVVSVFFPFTTHSSVMQRVVAERYRISVMTHGFSVTHSPDILLPCCSCGTAATHRAPKLLRTSSHEVPPWVRCERCVCVWLCACVGRGCLCPSAFPIRFISTRTSSCLKMQTLHHSIILTHTNTHFLRCLVQKGTDEALSIISQIVELQWQNLYAQASETQSINMFTWGTIAS